MKSATSLFLFSLLCCVSVLSSAEDKRSTSIDYEKINKMLTIVSEKTQSPYAYIEPRVVLKNPDLSFQDIRLWLTQAGQMIEEIPVSSEGLVDLPLLALDLQDLRLHINQAKGETTINIKLDVRPPENKQVPYRDLLIILSDFNMLTNEFAGVASWFVPDKKELTLTFSEASSLTIDSKNPVTLKTDENQRLVIRINKQLMKENPMISFSSIPLTVAVPD